MRRRAPVPELPETETIARDLDAALAGTRIVGVEVERPDVLREVDGAALARRLTGTTIQRAWRRAKLVVLDLDSDDRLVVQPRFTGALLVEAPGAPLPERERRFSTLHLRLADGRALHYRDIRRLGTVALMGPARWAVYDAGLGTEPLAPDFTPARLSDILRSSRQAVKKVLMDQRQVVGVGNIYANEACWRASIDPSREARSLTPDEVTRLHADIVGVLHESVAARGTSFRDYVDARGEKGGFVDRLAVYGREGHPCPRCGARLVGTHAVDGRTTVFCARCQR
jgi:formamidopyrimidine-DNA glycosylase